MRTDTPAGYRLCDIDESALPEFRKVDELAFAITPDPEVQRLVPFTVPLDRCRAVRAEDGQMVAVHGSYPFTLPVPGDEVPTAGLTWVGVRADHRRRGLLSAMIRDHLDRSTARGEVVSILFAAETAIYGRFGYGSAAQNLRLTLPRGATLRDVPGSAELRVRFGDVDPQVHGPVVTAVEARAAAGRPGRVQRTLPAMLAELLADPPQWRRGSEPLRAVTVHTADGEARAYALLRREPKWDEGIASGAVRVLAADAIDAPARHRLWSFLTDLDLTGSVRTPMLPVDDPLLSMLIDIRGARPVLSDNIWLRLLDVPAALAARRYQADLDLVLRVTDEQRPACGGTWRLTTTDADAAGTRTARVAATDAEPDLVLGTRDLAAAYLGGTPLTALADAGLAQAADPAVLRRAAAAFGWPLAPVCTIDF